MKRISKFLFSASMYLLGYMAISFIMKAELWSIQFWLLIIPVVYLITFPVMEYWDNKWDKWTK